MRDYISTYIKLFVPLSYRLLLFEASLSATYINLNLIIKLALITKNDISLANSISFSNSSNNRKYKALIKA